MKKKLREESPEFRNLLGVKGEGEGEIKMMSKSSAWVSGKRATPLDRKYEWIQESGQA